MAGLEEDRSVALRVAHRAGVGRVFLTVGLIASSLLVPPPRMTLASVALDDSARAFRESFGLETDPSILNRESMSAASTDRFGVRVTEAEMADLDARIELQDALLPLVEFVNKNADVLGGVWLDQRSVKHEAVVEIARTAYAPDATVAAAVALAPAGAIVAVTEVKNPLAVLWATVSKVIDAEDPAINGVELDIPDNRVVVRTATGGLPTSVTDTAAIVTAEAGMPATPVSCTPAARCTFLPYRGGLQILDPNPAWWQCTSAYWGKQIATQTLFIITAAHCDHAPASTDAYRNGITTHLGSWNKDSVGGTGCTTTCNTDAFRVLVDASLVPATNRNCIYESAGLTCRTLTASAIWANIVAGTVVCAATVNSSVICGKVTSIGAATVDFTDTKYGRNITFTKGIWTDFLAQPGDSGSPEYAGSTAYGILSAIDGRAHKTFATSIQWALTDLGLSLCTTSTCPQ